MATSRRSSTAPRRTWANRPAAARHRRGGKDRRHRRRDALDLIKPAAAPHALLRASNGASGRCRRCAPLSSAARARRPARRPRSPLCAKPKPAVGGSLRRLIPPAVGCRPANDVGCHAEPSRQAPSAEGSNRRPFLTSERVRLGREVDATPLLNGDGHSQRTLQSQSPLPDSNRRPLPYHGGPAMPLMALQTINAAATGTNPPAVPRGSDRHVTALSATHWVPGRGRRFVLWLETSGGGSARGDRDHGDAVPPRSAAVPPAGRRRDRLRAALGGQSNERVSVPGTTKAPPERGLRGAAFSGGRCSCCRAG